MLETKKYITEEDMIMLDEELEFVPLTFDGLFKGIFKKDLELLKTFILVQLEIDINPDACKIELLDSELPKDNKREYQKTVDIYVKIDNIYVNIEVNREYFKDVEKRNFIFADKLHTMLLESGQTTKDISDKIFVQINLNAIDKLDENKQKLKYGTDKIVTYGINSGKIYNSNKYILIKYLAYYRDLYYNKGEKLDKSSLWLVLLASKNYQELYNVAGELFNEKIKDKFIRKVINMVKDGHVFADWELEKLNDLVEYTKNNRIMKECLEEGLEKGIEQGIEQGIKQGIKQGTRETTNEYIKNMLKENLSIEIISKVTNKTKEEILKIKNNL